MGIEKQKQKQKQMERDKEVEVEFQVQEEDKTHNPFEKMWLNALEIHYEHLLDFEQKNVMNFNPIWDKINYQSSLLSIDPEIESDISENDQAVSKSNNIDTLPEAMMVSRKAPVVSSARRILLDEPKPKAKKKSKTKAK